MIQRRSDLSTDELMQFWKEFEEDLPIAFNKIITFTPSIEDDGSSGYGSVQGFLTKKLHGRKECEEIESIAFDMWHLTNLLREAKNHARG